MAEAGSPRKLPLLEELCAFFSLFSSSRRLVGGGAKDILTLNEERFSSLAVVVTWPLPKSM